MKEEWMREGRKDKVEKNKWMKERNEANILKSRRMKEGCRKKGSKEGSKKGSMKERRIKKKDNAMKKRTMIKE